MQPTARSAPAASSLTGTDPAEWHRSHSTRAPASCTSAVIRGHVGERAATVGDVRQADQRDVGPERGEQRVLVQAVVQVGMDHPSSQPRCAATPAST